MESGHNTIEFIQCVFLLYVLHSMVLSFHLIFYCFEDNDCCDKSTKLPRNDKRDSSRACKRSGAAALWANKQVGS